MTFAQLIGRQGYVMAILHIQLVEFEHGIVLRDLVLREMAIAKLRSEIRERNQ